MKFPLGDNCSCMYDLYCIYVLTKLHINMYIIQQITIIFLKLTLNHKNIVTCSI